jgi:cation transport ATPase
VEVIKEGQVSHAKAERLADTLAGYFTPFVVFASLSVWIIW